MLNLSAIPNAYSYYGLLTRRGSRVSRLRFASDNQSGIYIGKAVMRGSRISASDVIRPQRGRRWHRPRAGWLKRHCSYAILYHISHYNKSS